MTCDNLIEKLKGRDLVQEGSRNNDMVNLCILSVIDCGLPQNAEQLLANVMEVIRNRNLQLVDNCDYGYMEEKAGIIFPYLSDWDAQGILAYAIE